MPRELKPVELAAPAAAYAHGVHVPAGHELSVTSGVVLCNTGATVSDSGPGSVGMSLAEACAVSDSTDGFG